MAEVKRALSNNQKAQILLDVLKGVNINAEIDKAISKRKYKVHSEKLRNFQYEMQEILAAKTEVRGIFGVSFRSMAILEKARWDKQRIEDSISKKMAAMYSKIGGAKKQVVFGATKQTRTVEFAK
jgi:hypothetical protein